MKHTLLALSLTLSLGCHSNTSSPYINQMHNEIKSLTKSEISGLLQGKGMGFAKAAELNHYPGPKHVLELAEELELTKQQKLITSEIYKSMKQQAKALGDRLISQERELEELFATQIVTPDSLNAILLEIGKTRAKLRGIHLMAHVKMREVLSQKQIHLYDKYRGYKKSHLHHNHNH